jgi:protoporphyrinogen oxidase
MNIAIIGGGLMGLALARRLSGKGHTLTVFERDQQLGGLATYHNYGPFSWDRFYHCILPSDTHLIDFLKEMGLGQQLRWARTLTGFYVDQQFHSLSSNLEFLRFPAVSLLGKLRLALTILYCSRINNWQRLEQIPVEDWLVKACGRATYEKLWQPLLLAKLGENYRRVSAVFIWSYIKRLFSARDSSAQKEHLGYVAGGYKTVFTRLDDLIRAGGGEILAGVAVKRLTACPQGGLWVEYDQQRVHFDKIVFTGPVNILQHVAAPELVNVTSAGGTVEYLGVVCMVMVTRKPLVPYYVVNIADRRIPFTGIIGMSNLVSSQDLAGYHLTYLPKYVLSDDPMLRQTDEKLRTLFLDGLGVMFPQWQEAEIEGVHINRAIKVQPLPVLNYSRLAPQVSTAHQDFFVLNTSQFVNCTLNNNEVVRLVGEFLNAYGSEFEPHNHSKPKTSMSHALGNWKTA